MDLADRFPENPVLTPSDLQPSVPGAVIACLLNPGAFRWRGRTGLLMRVAERMPQQPGQVSTLVADAACPAGVRVVAFAEDDPKLDRSDPRVFVYDGVPLLSTLSHLRLAWSDDGRTFVPEPEPTLTGTGPLETFGVEDCRVTQIDDTYHLTYPAVSENGVGVALKSTCDWRTFADHGLILPPHNKDCALFERRINGAYAALHRPVGAELGGLFIWYATSPDLRHWGSHHCLARTRPGRWDSQRIGAGAAPIRTDAGWLEIYHGCDENSRYCLGALLLDIDDPRQVLARSDEPIMEPTAEYEQQGFFGNVVFTNGHVVDGDRLRLYYGASDTVICGADLSIRAILELLLAS
jgi:predicted GH43/DUF377 family glycosyl hydrolase